LHAQVLDELVDLLMRQIRKAFLHPTFEEVGIRVNPMIVVKVHDADGLDTATKFNFLVQVCQLF
jgi:hypothetical protein